MPLTPARHRSERAFERPFKFTATSSISAPFISRFRRRVYRDGKFSRHILRFEADEDGTKDDALCKKGEVREKNVP